MNTPNNCILSVKLTLKYNQKLYLESLYIKKYILFSELNLLTRY